MLRSHESSLGGKQVHSRPVRLFLLGASRALAELFGRNLDHCPVTPDVVYGEPARARSAMACPDGHPESHLSTLFQGQFEETLWSASSCCSVLRNQSAEDVSLHYTDLPPGPTVFTFRTWAPLSHKRSLGGRSFSSDTTGRTNGGFSR